LPPPPELGLLIEGLPGRPPKLSRVMFMFKNIF
jgi:hypothetical protein